MKRILGLCALVALAASGCDGKDSAACATAQDAVRKSIAAQDWALAQQWRDRAWKKCDDETSLRAMDESIVAAKKKLADEKAAAEADAKKKQDMISQFQGWAAANRSQPDQAAKITCTGDDADKLKKERWCEGTRALGPYLLKVTYWEKEPKAARFRIEASPWALTCADLGGTPKRSWTHVSAPVQRHHCTLGGVLTGMEAIVTEAKAPVEVFTPEMAERHYSLKKRIAGQ